MTRTLAVVIALVIAAPPGVARAAPPGPALDWGACAGGTAAVQCAELRLPVDWADPGGPGFDLAVARRPARVPSGRVGTLVFGPGGPGDSGVDRLVRGSARFSDEILDSFDVVSFDPRTVAGSAAPTCAREPVPVILRDQADFDATVAANRALWQQCRETSPVFDHASTRNTALDLEALRRALGESRLTFHGSSYGTLLGQQYAGMFPGRVRAAVLEGVFDHSLSLTDFVRTQAVAVQDSFDEFVTWCERGGRCPPGVRDTWTEVLARADDGEYAPFTAFDVAALPIATLQGPNWPALAAAIEALAAGRTDLMRGLPPASTGAFCADFPVPVRNYREYTKLLRVAAKAGPDIRYGAGLLAVSLCLGWPRPVDNPPHRPRVQTRVPMLLLNARHDPRTGYEWATHVAGQLGRNGRLVTYEGWGHGVYRDTACTTATVDRYLIDLVVPARGASCPAEPVS
ncbi:alpha/beta hydrolase [Actinoplanes sp. CA-015351]|uniref:alpha/beta hydrolase n=1 Tax=Actinoplanes sp. CA-015351 TaxID=3239897 RepID=UPI003D958164